MKRIFTLALIGAIPVFLLGQVPQAINYQVVVRDTAGNILTNETVNFEIEILQNGFDVYSEKHNDKNTGDLGIVNLKIGNGDFPSSDFSQIDWSLGQYQLRVWLNGQLIGDADLLSVPFALYAERVKNDDKWVSIGDSILHSNGKRVGIKTNLPEAELDVNGEIIATSALSVKPGPSSIDNSSKLIFAGAQTEPGLGFDYFGMYYNQGANSQSNQKNLWVFGSASRKMNLCLDGHMAIGRLKDWSEIFGTLELADGPSWTSSNWGKSIVMNDANAIMWKPPTGPNWGIGASSSSNKLFFFTATADNTSVAPNYLAYLDTEGMFSVKVLQVLGSDIVEKSQSTNLLQPGEVIVIDPSQPNHVLRSDKAYDRTVIGVVSGAGGVQHGMELSQAGMLDGNTAFAIAGRVYVKVTGRVKPGDLLTTSNLPGIAMKAKNPFRKNGTIIGKALSCPNASGLVLMLVQTR